MTRHIPTVTKPRVEFRETFCGCCGAKRMVPAGASLKAVRERANVSMRWLANQINVSPALLCDVEHDRRRATEHVLNGYYSVQNGLICEEHGARWHRAQIKKARQ